MPTRATTRAGPAAGYTHKATDTNCSTCHNGTVGEGSRHDDARPGDRRPVQQLPQQLGVELPDLHHEPYGRGVGAVRQLPQRQLHDAGHEGRDGDVDTGHVATSGDGLQDLPYQHEQLLELGRRRATPTRPPTRTARPATTEASAKGLDTTKHIPVTGVQCSNCHNSSASSFQTYTMSHTAVASARCDSCHNGNYKTQGTKGAMGVDTGHVATNGDDCKTCHTNTSNYSSWARRRATRTRPPTRTARPATTEASAKGLDTTTHIPVTGVQCSNCHNSSASSFHDLHHEPYGRGVGAVRQLPQRQVHDPGHEGRDGRVDTGHVATNGADCKSCHTNTSNYTSWAGGELHPRGQRHELLDLPQRNHRRRV